MTPPSGVSAKRPTLRVAIEGGGAVSESLSVRLRSSGVELVSLASAPDLAILIGPEGGAVLDRADEVIRGGTPTIVAALGRREISVGPLTVPGKTACPRCLSSEAAPSVDAPDCPDVLAGRAADEIVAAALLAWRGDPRPATLLRQRTVLAASGGRDDRAAWPRAGCPACAGASVRPTAFDVAAGLAHLAAPSVTGAVDASERKAVRRVGVLGGGTAGYLTALALRAACPHLEVTVVESSKIPIIGVGEATTPDLVEFLHGTLGVDELELYREVLPTWKLGIRFAWGPTTRPHFHHPFSGPHLLEAIQAGDQDLQSLAGALMARDLAPVFRTEGRATSMLRSVPYAYHLDNERFVRFLHKLAVRAGVERVDAEIADVAVDERGVAGLTTKEGRVLAFDLYVDATGFRSLLLEKALSVPFVSYAKTLFCDTAVTADVPHGGKLAPYTLAQTMDSGWCWKIPQREDDHRGYVFASSHCSVDRAIDEMRQKNPAMGETRVVKFRSGRLERCWEKNVFAIGNSYAFVEPLESTALHMIVFEIGVLLSALSGGETTDRLRARVNRVVGDHWDCLRDFLALHYKFNERLETPFWRDVRETVDLAGGQLLLDAFRAGAPLTARPDSAIVKDSLFGDGFFGLLGVDNLLLGQRVPGARLRPLRDTGAFERWSKAALPALLERALPVAEGIDAHVEQLERRR